MADSDRTYNRRAVEKEFGFSQAVLAGDFLFVSGCVSWDMEGNPLHLGNWGKQVEEVYADIGETLKAHGLSAGNIVKETVYCRDMDELIATNEKRMRFYGDSGYPASTWVQISRLVHPDLLLEVEVTAFRG